MEVKIWRQLKILFLRQKSECGVCRDLGDALKPCTHMPDRKVGIFVKHNLSICLRWFPKIELKICQVRIPSPIFTSENIFLIGQQRSWNSFAQFLKSTFKTLNSLPDYQIMTSVSSPTDDELFTFTSVWAQQQQLACCHQLEFAHVTPASLVFSIWQWAPFWTSEFETWANEFKDRW